MIAGRGVAVTSASSAAYFALLPTRAQCRWRWVAGHGRPAPTMMRLFPDTSVAGRDDNLDVNESENKWRVAPDIPACRRRVRKYQRHTVAKRTVSEPANGADRSASPAQAGELPGARAELQIRRSPRR
jgi:hypothetical protein